MNTRKNLFSRTFRRYIATYAIMLALPVMIMVYVARVYFLSAYREEIIANTIEGFSHSTEILDIQLKQLETIAVQIGNDSRLRRVFLEQALSNSRDVRTALQNLDFPNDFVSRIVYFFRHSGEMYSSEGPFSVESFTTYISNYSYWTPVDFLNTLLTIEQTTWRPVEDVYHEDRVHKRFLTCMMPIPLFYSIPQATVLFQIEENSLRTYLDTGQEATGALSCLFDTSGTLLASFGSDSENLPESLFSPTIDQVNKTETLIHSEIRKNGTREYLFILIRSGTSAMFYVRLVPLELALNEFRIISSQLQMSVYLILFLGFIMVFVFSYTSYSPIRGLVSLVRKTTDKVPQNLNEFDAARFVITNLSVSVHESKPSVREHLLLQLLKGGFNNIGEFNEKAGVADITFSGSHFTVFLVSFDRERSEGYDNISKFIDFIENIVQKNVYTKGFEGISSNTLVFIASADCLDDEVLEDPLHDVLSILQQQFSIQATIGVGNSCTDILNIQKSYLEAVTALDLQLIKGPNTVIFFREIVSVPEAYSAYPRREMETLERCLREADAERVEITLTDIVSIIKDRKTSLFLAKAVCSDIASVLMRAVYRYGRQSAGWKGVPDILTISQYRTADELAEMLLTAAGHICGFIRESESPRARKPMDFVVEYVLENYTSPSFSIQTVADQFSISVSNLSHQFKSHTGTTFSEYIHKLRIEKAKEILVGTGQPLRVIVREIGYIDTSSFIRKFRDSTGKTPGEYRKFYQAGKNV